MATLNDQQLQEVETHLRTIASMQNKRALPLGGSPAELAVKAIVDSAGPLAELVKELREARVAAKGSAPAPLPGSAKGSLGR